MKFKYKQKYYEYVVEIAESQDTLDTPQKVFEIIKDNFSPIQESLWLIMLNTQNNIISTIEVSKGKHNSMMIDPKEIFIHLIKNGSPNFIIAHNHPSFTLKPSEEDLIMTRKVLKGSKLLGLQFLDHLIFTDKDFHSFRHNHEVF